MSEIEIGDKGTWRGHEVVVKGIDGDVIWLKLGDGDYIDTRSFVPAPKTFEVGKTYRHKGDFILKFRCDIEGPHTFGGKLTLMQNVIGNISIDAGKFSDWEEI